MAQFRLFRPEFNPYSHPLRTFATTLPHPSQNELARTLRVGKYPGLSITLSKMAETGDWQLQWLSFFSFDLVFKSIFSNTSFSFI